MSEGRIYTEQLYAAYGQRFVVDKVLFEIQTEHQHLIIFENSLFGRVMALDGAIQTTEKDEFIYHEMLTHVPIHAHAAVSKVLIIGGGDGGALREVCKHRQIKSIVQVEIDAAVIETCKKYLPNHSAGAFADPRVRIEIADGVDYVNNITEKFDIIISDSTDPNGPGEALFTSPFYSGCKRCLTPAGIFVAQNGVAFMQPTAINTTYQRFANLFSDRWFYGAAIPTYIGGIMAFAWGSDSTARHNDLPSLQRAFQTSAINTRYYTPEIHHAAFALPAYLCNSLR